MTISPNPTSPSKMKNLYGIPDQTPSYKFRHFLEKSRLTEALFWLGEDYLPEQKSKQPSEEVNCRGLFSLHFIS